MFTQLKNFLTEKKADILALIILTTTFLSIKGIVDLDTRNYIDSAFAIILLGSTAIKFGVNRFKK